MKMRLIDTHCHLDLYNDFEVVLAECDNEGIYTIAVTNTPSVFARCAELTRDSRFVRPAVGLHPELAVARIGELALLDQLLPKTRYVGEVGLDYVTRDAAQRHTQRQVFEFVLERCAEYGDKVLTVHSRRAEHDVLDMIGEGYPGAIILHWFSGPRKVLERAVARDYYFSLNPAMLASTEGRRIVAALPADRVLTETDGPFVSVRGRPARPSDLTTVISDLAHVWNIETVAAARRVFDNFKRVLTLSG